ncbi:MAG: RidA family protein [Cytophagales bacterium]|nr:RidA family protein [Cytophagales bacterium]
MKHLILCILGVCFFNSGKAQTQFISPEGLNKPTSYTHVVVAGNTIYISGQVSNNEKGEVVGKGDFEAQVKQVFENLSVCLKAAGASFDDVVKLTTFVVNYQPVQGGIIRSVRQGYLTGKNPPASTLLGVQALASPDYLLEIEAVAVKK